MDILLDTGFLVALMAKDSQHHDTAKAILEKYSRANYHTLWECVTEAGHFLNIQGRYALLNWLAEYGVTVHSSRVEDLKDMATYIKKYPNVSKGKGADIADVALVFLANRLKSSYIFTVDRADFTVYRTKTGKPFTRLWVHDGDNH
ncbi:MAG TPA: PIN domain-containing protein [Agitococcus sp.]|nr:PIN domain-containing protein [Agitococcus sp.]